MRLRKASEALKSEAARALPDGGWELSTAGKLEALAARAI